ncbi:hypothetical protein SteCoe_6225 [Stentor coeruleus]|uniref:Uncharacterized protein n=1 Tax=Stentor coeruleus TaxID=5963 RepID=A0A1R2CQG3_9CILI|nr:hypothetical protein SteCoe_6225 [Stentor coeruleus]
MEDCKDPILRVLLTNDGSMTIALQAIVLEKIRAEIIQSLEVMECEYFPCETIQREIVLTCGVGKVLYALSYIRKDFHVRMGFGQGVPIGLVMKNNKIEQFRDVYSIKFEEISEELSQKLNIPRQKLFQRSYHVYSSNQSQMHIHEILLPDLQNYLSTFHQA